MRTSDKGNDVFLLDYAYSAPGEYEVRCVATDAEQETGSDGVIVTVSDPSAGVPIIVAEPETSTWGQIKSEFKD